MDTPKKDVSFGYNENDPPAGGPSDNQSVWERIAPGPTVHETVLGRSLLRLPQTDLQNLSSEFKNFEERLQSKATSASLKDELKMPFYYAAGRTLILPSGVLMSSEFTKLLFAMFGRDKGVTIRYYADESPLPKITEEQENLVFGIYSALKDPDKPVRIFKNEKDNPYELGKILVRGLQINAIFGRYHIQKAQVRNHRVFANNPGETTEVNKKSIPVIPIKDHLRGLFKGHRHETELVSCLEALIKQTSTDFKESVRNAYIEEALMPINIYVSSYFAQTRLVNLPGRRGIERVGKVPVKPAPSPLLLPEERGIFNTILEPVFNDSLGIRTKSEFLSEILKPNGLAKIDETLKAEMNKRGKALQSFANLTTKRLQEARKLASVGPARRKADIRTDDLIAAFSIRKDPLGRLAQEIYSFKDIGTMSQIMDLDAVINKGLPEFNDSDYLLCIRSYLSAKLAGEANYKIIIAASDKLKADEDKKKTEELRKATPGPSNKDRLAVLDTELEAAEEIANMLREKTRKRQQLIKGTAIHLVGEPDCPKLYVMDLAQKCQNRIRDKGAIPFRETLDDLLVYLSEEGDRKDPPLTNKEREFRERFLSALEANIKRMDI
jgi:hypothetical protein